MKSWRKAVVALLRAALRAGQVRTELGVDQMDVFEKRSLMKA